jgi:hypothetical protein
MAQACVTPDIELLEMATLMCARAGGVNESLHFLGQATVLGFTAT